MASTNKDLRKIQSFESLVRYLEDELDWPLHEYDFDDVVFSYEPQELGLKDEDAAKIKRIYQMRPLESGQPWGIFFIEFEKSKLPVAVLRRILNHLVLKKRASANRADRAAWNTEDLLFISAFGEETVSDREIAFAHFHEEQGDKPTLRVLGWDGSDTPLKLEHLERELKHKLHWPEKIGDKDAWRKEWSSAFRHKIGHTIQTASELAEVLAKLAKKIRNAAQILMEAETDNGRLTKLYTAFKAALIHDLTSEGFADTYAQTITYGLLTAAISRTEWSEGRYGTSLVAEDMAEMVPVTNPFLKDMLQTFLKAGGRKGGIDFDELGVQDVVELLRGDETDLPAVIRDFGNKKPGEDPVIHFYEHFLSAYNKKLKIQRGVFYTPQPVVSYIVRSVHELLQTEFGIEDGLASTITWAEMLAKNPELKLPTIEVAKDHTNQTVPIDPSTPFVQILDPATGTGTFLVEVIDVIHKTLEKKWNEGGLSQPEQRAAWNEYVPKHLLPRLHGYEIMMAPYAIAHMKLGLKLYETGYRFGSDERARVYLTNSLEPPQDFSDRLAFDAPELAHEAQAVNGIKRQQRFTVVIGNPPYSKISYNQGRWISDLMERYKVTIKKEEIQRQALSNDYVKFFCLATNLLSESGTYILGLITDDSFLDGPLFRDMRADMMISFPSLKVIDLKGNARKGESLGIDENVFEIKQGVSISIGYHSPSEINSFTLYTERVGKREQKYEWLSGHSGSNTPMSLIHPSSPSFLFIPQSDLRTIEWKLGVSLPEVFFGGTRAGRSLSFNGAALATRHDEFAIGFTKEELISKLRIFFDSSRSSSELKKRFNLCGTPHFSFERARSEVSLESAIASIRGILYRPFDARFVAYHGLLIGEARPEVMGNLLFPNLALLSTRRTTGRPYDNVFVSSGLVEYKAATHDRNTQVFPLYLYANNRDIKGQLSLSQAETLRRPNLNPTLFGEWQMKNGFRSPEYAFHYIYALLFAPSYRTTYRQELRQDYARVMVSKNQRLCNSLESFGGELVALHLMASPKLDTPITEFIGGRAPEVEKISYSDNTVWIDKAKTVGFAGVNEAVWNFHIGGYQVCDKWLKDRKGRKLLSADISHYHKIVVALHETIRVMREIDEVIEAHGGWPLK